LFPELGALSHDVFTRPRGAWARAPLLLAITPVLTGALGIIFTRALPYGLISVLATVGASIATVLALDSPIAPAISAGLLPLVLGVTSWWYPPGIAFGTTLLALLSIVWRNLIATGLGSPPAGEPELDDALELVPAARRYQWLGALMLLVAAAALAVRVTGLRFILFPPLVVIAFEMFGHAEICPWARRPLLLPLACFLTAAGGLLSYDLLGVGAGAAALAMAWGIIVLRTLDLHVPPALAIALLPQVMAAPTLAYPFAVGIGTMLATLWFVAWQALPARAQLAP